TRGRPPGGGTDRGPHLPAQPRAGQPPLQAHRLRAARDQRVPLRPLRPRGLTEAPLPREQDGGPSVSVGSVPDENASEAPTVADLLRWSESLAGIARTGLGFTESRYEQERFEEVLAVAADIWVAAGSAFEPETLVEEWMASVGKGVAGYQTHMVAVGDVVGNDVGE